jgi:hypothetical protein
MRPRFPFNPIKDWRAFLAGMGSIMDIWGGSWRHKYRSPYGYSKDPWAEDREALQRDWEKVMGDFRRAAEIELKKIHEQKERDKNEE